MDHGKGGQTPSAKGGERSDPLPDGIGPGLELMAHPVVVAGDRKTDRGAGKPG